MKKNEIKRHDHATPRRWNLAKTYARDHGVTLQIWLGLRVDGCSMGSAFAHAHNRTGRHRQFGIVCVHNRCDIDRLWKDGRPGRTLLHEIAHIKAPNTGHSPKWRKVFKKMLREEGYTDPVYVKHLLHPYSWKAMKAWDERKNALRGSVLVPSPVPSPKISKSPKKYFRSKSDRLGEYYTKFPNASAKAASEAVNCSIGLSYKVRRGMMT